MSAIVGTRVRKRRERLQMTQEGLANLLGVQIAWVSRIEREERGTTTEGLVGLCKALETTQNYLLGFSRRP